MNKTNPSQNDNKLQVAMKALKQIAEWPQSFNKASCHLAREALSQLEEQEPQEECKQDCECHYEQAGICERCQHCYTKEALAEPQEVCEHRKLLHKLDAVYCQICKVKVAEHSIQGVESVSIFVDDKPPGASYFDRHEPKMPDDSHYCSGCSECNPPGASYCACKECGICNPKL
jgi:hypothetical protein